MGIFLAEHIALSLQATREEPVDESALHGGKDISKERAAARDAKDVAAGKVGVSDLRSMRGIKKLGKFAARKTADLMAKAVDQVSGGAGSSELAHRRAEKAAAEKDARRAAIRAAVFKRRDDHRRNEKVAKGEKHRTLQFMTKADEQDLPDMHALYKGKAARSSSAERVANRMKRKRTAQGFALTKGTKKSWPYRPKRFPIGQKKAYDPASATWVDKAKHPSLMTRLKKD